MDRETAGKVRAMNRLARIRNVRDDGETQTCSAEVAEGIWHDDIEVLQPYGFGSHVPEDGALALVIAIGADEGHYVALPVGNPSVRMGGMQAGDVGLYNAGGDRMLMKAGGDVDLKTGASVNVKSPVATVQSDTVTIAASASGSLA